jgi:hypothetical protein
MAYLQPRISVSDSTTQVISVVNTPQVISFNSFDQIRKIIPTSSSRFTIQEPGFYQIVSLPQVQLTSGSNQILSIWVRKNGVDITNSNNRWILPSNGDFTFPTLNYVSCVAGDFLEMWMSGQSTSCQISAFGTLGGAPATPSIVMVILKTS